MRYSSKKVKPITILCSIVVLSFIMTACQSPYLSETIPDSELAFAIRVDKDGKFNFSGGQGVDFEEIPQFNLGQTFPASAIKGLHTITIADLEGSHYCIVCINGKCRKIKKPH